MPDDGDERRVPPGRRGGSPDPPAGRDGPRPLRIVLAVMVVSWIALLLILSRTQSLRRQAEPQATLPVYPSASDFSHSSLPDRDWQTATYSVGLDYPSLEVFYYYDEEMTNQGWTREGQKPDIPQWRVSRERAGRRRAALTAAWISPDALLRVELNLQWEEPAAGAQARRGEGGEEAEDHMRVTATMSRTVVPMFSPPEGQGKAEQQTPFGK